VGPSIAAGSHGWRPNCADLPIAAIRAQIKTRFNSHFGSSGARNAFKSHLLLLYKAMLIRRMIPISPMRL